MTLSCDSVNIPVRLNWHGWDSDTYKLKVCGWKIFVSEEISAFEDAKDLRIAARDPDGRIMIYGSLKIEMRMLMSWSKDGLAEILAQRGIDMSLFRAEDRIHTYTKSMAEWIGMDAMLETDGMASVPYPDYQIRNIKELSLFKYTERPKEIYLPSASVDQCLDQILRVQFPQAQLLKAKIGEQRERPVTVAKIYSLAA